MSFPSIQILFQDKILQTISFQKESLSIGRMKENDITIDNLAVSRFHAKLFLENGKIFLEDQGSENGSYVNGRRIQKCEIHPKDDIVIGKHRLLLVIPSEVTPQFSSLFNENRQTPVSSQSATSESVASAPSAHNKTSSPWDASATYSVETQTQQKISENIQKKEQSLQGKSSDQGSKPNLTVKQEGYLEQHIPLDKDSFYIGRAAECDLVLDHPRVSRRHAVLVRMEGQYKIQDLDTGNGTFVNNKKISQFLLNPQDVISIGPYQINYSEEGRKNTAKTQPEILEISGKMKPVANSSLSATDQTPESTIDSEAPTKESGIAPPPSGSPALLNSSEPSAPPSPPSAPVAKETEEALSKPIIENISESISAQYPPDTEPISLENISPPAVSESGDKDLAGPPSQEESISSPFTLTIEIDFQALPPSLQESLKPFLSSKVEIPLKVFLKPKKQND